MNIKKFKIGDRVKVSRNGSNASQFNTDIMGVYSLNDWENTTFEIEGTIKLTDFKNEALNTTAHLLNYKGKPIGYVYTDAIEKAAEITETEIKQLETILNKVNKLGVSTGMMREEGSNYNYIKILSNDKEIVEIKTTKVW